MSDAASSVCGATQPARSYLTSQTAVSSLPARDPPSEGAARRDPLCDSLSFCSFSKKNAGRFCLRISVCAILHLIAPGRLEGNPSVRVALNSSPAPCARQRVCKFTWMGRVGMCADVLPAGRPARADLRAASRETLQDWPRELARPGGQTRTESTGISVRAFSSCSTHSIDFRVPWDHVVETI